MASQRTQHKQQRSVRNHYRSGGNIGIPGSTRLTTKVPRETPGAPLPTRSDTSGVDGLTALDFASAARYLTLATQRRGLNCPLFRSPPDLPGISRSLRHNRDGSVTVSVVVRGRYRLAVLADMIDGVVAANALEFGDASRIRDELWSSISSESVSHPVVSQPDESPSDQAERVTEAEAALDADSDRSVDGLAPVMVRPVAA